VGLRRIVAASIGIFVIGLTISAVFYFSSRPIVFTDGVISNWLSPEGNPHGCLAAALGTGVAAVVLAPSALLFYRRLSPIHKLASMAGAACYAAGLPAAILIAGLSPVRGLDFSIHLMLAYVAFISLQAGVSIYLTIAATKSRSGMTFAALKWLLPIAFLTLSFVVNADTTALCEWGPCATIGTGLWVLASWCS
jgi:hypothetical protein